MALIAGQCPVCSCQRKARGRIVVERTRLPGSIRMTSLAFTAEPCSRVHRVGRGIEIFQVTSHASRGCSYIPKGMAFDTSQTQVSTLEREGRRFVMVECCIGPSRFIMTHLAIGWKLRSRMCRVRRGIVVFQVTSHAGGRSTCKAL